MSIRAGAWLAAHDLRVRWPRVVLAAVVMTALAGAAVTMELLARAREEAIAARIDSMGPPLTVVPAGTTAEALGRYDLGEALLPAGAREAVVRALGSSVRRLDGRLVRTAHVAGRQVPVVGIDSEAWVEDLGGEPGIVVGAELARWLPPGESVRLGAGELRVTRAASPVGAIDDAGLFVPLEMAERLAGTKGLNELRVFLRAGVHPEEAEERLQGAIAGAAVIVHDRGSVAGSEAQESLAAHRVAAYAMLALVALLCLLVAAYSDAAERRVELATLVAIGTPSTGILSLLLFRSVITGAAGAALGAILGTAVAAIQDPAVSAAWVRWLDVGGVAVMSAAGVAALASLGVGLAALHRDPVADLQQI